jgi:Uma2 family endonuclease
VRVSAALTLDRSEPEPDLFLIDLDAPRPYHPGTAKLVIEVAVSSQRRDLRTKPPIYARAGVPLYWVIDIDARRAVVHREPGPDGYANVEMLGRTTRWARRTSASRSRSPTCSPLPSGAGGSR